MGQTMEHGVRHFPVYFAEWGITVQFLRTADNAVYVAVRPLCRELGIDAHRQLARLRDDATYSAALCELPVPSAGGTQDTTCIRQAEAAWWLVHIDDARCKPAIRGQLEQIKQALVATADRLIFGDLSGVVRPDTLARRRVHGAIHGDCPRCRAALRVETDDSGARFVIDDD